MITCKASTDQSNKYLESYNSRHIYNKKNSFFIPHAKSYKFIITKEKVIRLENVGTIKLNLLNESNMIFLNIFYLRYNSNLFFFEQLTEAGISYHKHSKNIILKKTRNIISLVQRRKNLSVLDFKKIFNKIMISQGRD